MMRMVDAGLWNLQQLLAESPFTSVAELYRVFIEQLPAVAYLDTNERNPRSVYLSPYVERMLGRPAPDYLADPDAWMSQIYAADRDRVTEEWVNAVATEEPFDSEYRMTRPDGAIIWVRDRSRPLRDRNGQVVFWQGVVHDITASKKAEAALREAEARYRTLVEQLPAVVYIKAHEPTPLCLYVSPQCQDMLGYPPSAYLADPGLWARAVHPDDRERAAAEWAHAVETGQPLESDLRIVRPTGDVIWVRCGCVPVRATDGTVLFWQGVMRDVTDSKETEEALRRSESQHRALVENIPAVVYVVAPDDYRMTLYVSPQVETTLGYTRDEWLDQPDIWMELLHPDDREPTLAAYDLANETGQPWSREYRLIASDGRAVWFRDVATLVRDKHGNPQHWHGVQLDITELKQAEEALRLARDDLELRVMERTTELEEANEMMVLEIAERKRAEQDLRAAEHRYRLLVEQIPAVTYVWEVGPDLDGPRLSYTSPRIEQLLGYTVEEWHSTADFWMSRLHPDDRTRVLAAALRSYATGEPFVQEYRFLDKGGRVVWVLDQAVLLERDARGNPKTFHGVTLDITSRKEAETRASETESRLQMLADHVPALPYTWVLRPSPEERGLEYTSPNVRQILGYTLEEWRSQDDFWVTILHPDDRERVLEEMRRLEDAGAPWSIEYRMIAKDGCVVWFHDEGRVVERDAAGRPKVVQGLMLDVSACRRAQEELSETEQKYRTLVEQVPAMISIELPGGGPAESRFLYLSPQTLDILGYAPEELIANPDRFGEMLHPDDRERVQAASDRCEKTGEPFDQEYRIVAKNGRVVWLHSKSTLVRDQGGRPRFWHGVALDVTARKEAEESLRELEGRFRRLTAPPTGTPPDLTS
ncbi:MAG: PAS domain-containing protein [Actinomycetota bacterium]